VTTAINHNETNALLTSLLSLLRDDHGLSYQNATENGFFSTGNNCKNNTSLFRSD
jgi:hypothetical protein